MASQHPFGLQQKHKCTKQAQCKGCWGCNTKRTALTTVACSSCNRFYSYDKMYSQDLREQTFADWPFREECNCTPEKMAKAGFVHCPSENEPDVACCFFCLIELEGWEPDDDPWSEHTKRSPNCGFITLKKDFTELTVAEFYHMEKERLRIYVRKICHKKMAYLRDNVDNTHESLKTLLDSI